MSAPTRSGDARPTSWIDAPLPAPHPAVVHRAMPDGAVLFLPTTEVYFGLNATGAFVWDHLAPACATVGALQDAVALRYPEVDPACIAEDVAALLAALREHGLVGQAAPVDA